MKAPTADPKRVIHALAGAGDEAIERHRDFEAQLGHGRLMFTVMGARRSCVSPLRYSILAWGKNVRNHDEGETEKQLNNRVPASR